MQQLNSDVEAARTISAVDSIVVETEDCVNLTIAGTTFLLTLCDYPRGDAYCYNQTTKETTTASGTMSQIATTLAALVTPGDDAAPQRDGSFDDDDDEDANEDDDDAYMSTQDSGAGWYMGGREQSSDDPLSSSPLLQRETQVCEQLGINIHVTPVAVGFWIDLHLFIGDLISSSTSFAWGVKKDIPFVIQLRFERPEFTKCSRAPEVHVTQEGKQVRFGQQIRLLLLNYFSARWQIERGFVPMEPPKHMMQKTNSVDQANAQDTAIKLLTASQRLIYDELQRKGFPDDLCAAAAHQARTVSEASEMIVNGTVLEEVSGDDSAQGWLAALKKSRSGADPNKYVPYHESEGFLAHIWRYLRFRIPTCYQYCTICDQQHLIGAGLLKPAVCERELCCHRYHALAIGKDATDSVATGGGVIDLLVAMMRAAIESSRAEKILNPYPQVSIDNKLVFDPKNRDLEKLRRVIKQLPPTKELVGVENMQQLERKLAGKDPALFPLLSWCIDSNRSHIVKLRDEQRLACMATPQQFMLVTASPEKQLKFAELKAKHGTRLSWHGSQIENFHAILRVGLKNYSNTDKMVNAAAHGSGVYFATNAGTSLGYSRASNIQGSAAASSGHENSYFDGSNANSFACLILAEIINGYAKEHGWCHTVADEDAIMTRFFFVYQSTSDVQKAQSVQSDSPTFIKEVEALVNSLG